MESVNILEEVQELCSEPCDFLKNALGIDTEEVTPKYITDIDQDGVQLEVYECKCGCHIGVDLTYLDQVLPVNVKQKIFCMSCGRVLVLPDANEASRLKIEKENG